MAKQDTETLLQSSLKAAKHYLTDDQAELLERGMRVLASVVAVDVNAAHVASLRRKTDAELLVELAAAATAREPLPQGRRSRARLEGESAFQRLLEQAGGVLTRAEVSTRLNLNPDAIRKRVSRNTLLAVRRYGNAVYPAWQFDDQAEGGVVAHFPDILALLATDSAIAKCRFFLTPDRDLDGLTRIDALRQGKNLDLLRRKARQFGQQGAS